jgi:16S rRNA (uracil1498-N3)-methyltransferase
MVQKAVEMGARKLQPVDTRFTQVSRVNCERMRANVIEAAEQCGILSLAAVAEPMPLDRYLQPAQRTRCWCSATRRGDRRSRSRRCTGASAARHRRPDRPEAALPRKSAPCCCASRKPCGLPGPRILRADTAGVAALALVQAALGDWAGPVSRRR